MGTHPWGKERFQTLMVPMTRRAKPAKDATAAR